MKRIKPLHIAWLLPLAYLVHVAEEFYAGPGLPAWFAVHLNDRFSETDFVAINFIGFSLVLLSAILYSLGMGSRLVLVAFGTLFFVNGWVHLAANLLTGTYSPGTVSGLLLFIPLGVVTFRRILPALPRMEKFVAVAAGVLVHVLATTMALNA